MRLERLDAVYRPQAGIFGGRCDGKFGAPYVEVLAIQGVTRAGDNRVGVTWRNVVLET